MKAKLQFRGTARGAVTAAFAAFALILTGFARPARADIIAGYVQGHGGLSNPQTDNSAATGSDDTSAGLGLQAGVRLFIFEAYGDHTSLGAGTSTSRGILGLRGAIGLGTWRLVLRGGGGVISERGGALTGRLDGTPDRAGVVARAGAALEKKLARTLHAGVGVDGEVFSLFTGNEAANPGSTAPITGSDIFLSLHLKFEIGI